MKLVQVKTRGLGPVMETQWIELNGGLNLFLAKDLVRGRRFLTALQTINPPYSFNTISPFEDFPEVYNWQGYERQVIPAKRTVALGVFATEPQLVIELGKIDTALYETDRIEVGRRLDLSRWINFVEISPSTKWSEISDTATELIEALPENARVMREKLVRIVRSLKPSDRIVNAVEKELLNCLYQINNFPDGSVQKLASDLIPKVLRARHFNQARQIVSARLPLLSLIEVNSGLDAFKQELKQAVENSQQTFGTDPIFVFAAPKKSLASEERVRLFRLLQETAKRFQCLYMTDDKAVMKYHSNVKYIPLDEMEI